jgi:hypothetical protein
MAGSDITLSFPSIDALNADRLWTALSFALLGAVISGCVLFLKHKHTVSVVMISLILVALGSVAGGLFFMHHRIALIIHDLGSTVLISAESISAYEIGIFASTSVFLAALLLTLWVSQKKHVL